MSKEAANEKKVYIASISYGKDSLAMLEIIHRNRLPLDRIIHAEVMATPEIHSDLPPMIEFKDRADKIIFDKYGIHVERLKSVKSYEEYFYSKFTEKSRMCGQIYGFPLTLGSWCNNRLKTGVLEKGNTKAFKYIGIAVDEPKRIKSHPMKIYPLVDYGITEQWCRDWCEENGLLSPLYADSTRGGCWFCHKQRIGQLRLLRKNYPDLWKLLLKWDKDTVTTFQPRGGTVQALEERFEREGVQLEFFGRNDNREVQTVLPQVQHTDAHNGQDE